MSIYKDRIKFLYIDLCYGQKQKLAAEAFQKLIKRRKIDELEK